VVIKINSSGTIEVGNGVEIHLVYVDGETAKTWLRYNTHNRNFSERTCAGYVRDILAEDWPFTGDPIRWSEDWTLLDGQHRLEAIARTDIAQNMMVVTGLGEHTQRYMDGGRKRTAQDQLAIDKIANYGTVASIARMMILWNPKGLWDNANGCQIVGNKRPTTVPEILSFVHENPAIHRAASEAIRVQRLHIGTKASAVGAAYFRASTLDYENSVFETAQFFHKLGTGEDLSKGNPILAFRRSVERARTGDRSAGGNAQVPLLFKIIRTWNAVRAGELLEKMALPNGGLTNANFPDMH
jgi:hypothetical protein